MRKPERTKNRSTPAQPDRLAERSARSAAPTLPVDVQEVERQHHQHGHAAQPVERGVVGPRGGGSVGGSVGPCGRRNPSRAPRLRKGPLATAPARPLSRPVRVV